MKYNAFTSDHTMPSPTRHMNSLRQRVQFVAKHGGTTPKPFTEAVNRWEDWKRLTGTDPAQQLRNAYRDGADTATLAALHNAALIAEVARGVDKKDVQELPLTTALSAMRDAYKPAAAKNYGTIRDQFNTAAKAFQAAAQTVDITAPAEQLMSASDKARTAWTDAGRHAATLDGLVDALAHAATLAGTNAETEADAFALTVTIDEDTDRRAIWEAWDSDSRCGRWAALIDNGATINAPTLDQHTPYRRPKPIERRYDNATGKAYTFDPETGTRTS